MLPVENSPSVDVQQLEQEGFTHDQAEGLLILRALFDKGIYTETDPERKRLEFIKWLYTNGQLES